MSRSQFALFQSHLDLAIHYWTRLLKPGDMAIDATCGNGWDSLTLAKICLTPSKGKIFAFDIQATAIEATQKLLSQELSNALRARVEMIHGNHTSFPTEIEHGSIQLIVYNLGYLPKGNNKLLTTQTESTLTSLEQALKLLANGGAISITCYPGHPEGAREEKALLAFAETLDPHLWSCCHHRWLNRRQSPSLLLLQKSV
jgi:tRNA1(Val) A37 N6-methylase TrmN6